MTAQRTQFFTSPWRGEVAERSEAGGGESRSNAFTPPRPAFGRPTLPLQSLPPGGPRQRRDPVGRVFEPGALA
jgi:hypothetical protein